MASVVAIGIYNLVSYQLVTRRMDTRYIYVTVVSYQMTSSRPLGLYCTWITSLIGSELWV